jgi:DNA-binding response OmpR family regulator
MKILVVEDEPKTASYLRNGLVENGFVADVSHRGDDGLHAAFSELLARVRSVLRRGPGRHPDVLRVADLDIDVRRHHASRGGRRLDLTPKEFLLLSLFARRAGEVLSRTFIAEHVWVRTVRGLGYVLE